MASGLLVRERVGSWLFPEGAEVPKKRVLALTKSRLVNVIPYWLSDRKYRNSNIGNSVYCVTMSCLRLEGDLESLLKRLHQFYYQAWIGFSYQELQTSQTQECRRERDLAKRIKGFAHLLKKVRFGQHPTVIDENSLLLAEYLIIHDRVLFRRYIMRIKSGKQTKLKDRVTWDVVLAGLIGIIRGPKWQLLYK